MYHLNNLFYTTFLKILYIKTFYEVFEIKKSYFAIIFGICKIIYFYKNLITYNNLKDINLLAKMLQYLLK